MPVTADELAQLRALLTGVAVAQWRGPRPPGESSPRLHQAIVFHAAADAQAATPPAAADEPVEPTTADESDPMAAPAVRVLPPIEAEPAPPAQPFPTPVELPTQAGAFFARVPWSERRVLDFPAERATPLPLPQADIPGIAGDYFAAVPWTGMRPRQAAANADRLAFFKAATQSALGTAAASRPPGQRPTAATFFRSVPWTRGAAS